MRAGLTPLRWEAEEPGEQRYPSPDQSAQHKKPNFEGIQVNVSLSLPVYETEMTCYLFSLTPGLREVIYLFLT